MTGSVSPGADRYLGTDAVAEKAEITAGTIRLYLKRSRRRLKDGLPLRPHDLPIEEIFISRSPAWRESTIDAWLAARPGPGRWRSG